MACIIYHWYNCLKNISDKLIGGLIAVYVFHSEYCVFDTKYLKK